MHGETIELNLESDFGLRALSIDVVSMKDYERGEEQDCNFE